MYDFEKHESKTTTYIHKLNTFPTFLKNKRISNEKIEKINWKNKKIA